MPWRRVLPRERGSRFVASVASGSTIGHPEQGATRSRANECRSRKSMSRTSKPERNCASASISKSSKKVDDDTLRAALSFTIMPLFFITAPARTTNDDGNSALDHWPRCIPSAVVPGAPELGIGHSAPLPLVHVAGAVDFSFAHCVRGRRGGGLAYRYRTYPPTQTTNHSPT